MTLHTKGAYAKYAPPLIDHLPLVHQGKTRDTFALHNPNVLLVVASDRLSTHNVVHKSRIPFKGEVLTALTVFWLVKILDKVSISHHLSAYGRSIYKYFPRVKSEVPYVIEHRAIVVERLDMIPVEFILRCYLARAGSFFRDFYSKGIPDPYGINLPPGLPIMHRFPNPIFTPTDKSDTDDPLLAMGVMDEYGREYEAALASLRHIRAHLNSCGIEIVDTKFELGHDLFNNSLLADEIATPDSSRFCELADIREGVESKWLDKQIARDEAERIWGGSKGPPLEFSPEVVKRVSDTYLAIFERVTGRSLAAFQKEWFS